MGQVYNLVRTQIHDQVRSKVATQITKQVGGTAYFQVDSRVRGGTKRIVAEQITAQTINQIRNPI